MSHPFFEATNPQTDVREIPSHENRNLCYYIIYETLGVVLSRIFPTQWQYCFSRVEVCGVCGVCVCVVCVWVWVVMGGGVRAAGRPRAYRKVSTEL